jgi:hypothetical protein
MSSQEYQRAMDTLARETRMPPESAARIERQLLDAFESRDLVDVVQSPRMKSFVWFSRTGGMPITVSWRRWVPAAAAIALVASVAFVWWMNQPLVSDDHYHWAVPPRVAEKAPPAPALDPTTTQPSAVEVTTHPQGPDRKPAKKANVVTPSGFVDLPWTAGLPAFESGEIVRMDVPVASLPTYGIDISSGAGRGPVEADVLIGQDGFARAIRLVTTTSRSTQ